MQWFYNLSSRNKLLTGFGLVSLIAALIGIIAIYSSKIADDRDTFLYEKTTVPLGQLASIASDFQRIRVNAVKLAYSKDSAENQNSNNKIVVFDRNIRQNLKAYESTFIDEQDVINLKKLTDLYNEFFSEYQEFASFMAQGRPELAAEMVTEGGQLNLKGQEVTGQLEMMIKVNVETAKKTSDENTDNFHSMMRTLIIFIVLGIICAISLGLFISKYISGGIIRIVERIKMIENIELTALLDCGEKLAKGDMNITLNASTEPEEVKTKDEFGKLTLSLNQMIGRIQETIGSIKKGVDTLSATIEESNMLVNAAQNGELSKRGNTKNFAGGYRQLIEGLNSTFEAVVKPINDSGRVLAVLATGDLTVRITDEYKGDYAKLKDSINSFADSICSALLSVNEAVHATASAATQISSSTEQLSAGAQEQSQQTTEIAGAVEEMTKTILETTQNAGIASGSSKSARQNALKGVNKIIETKKGIGRIVDSSNNTARIITSLSARA